MGWDGMGWDGMGELTWQNVRAIIIARRTGGAGRGKADKNRIKNQNQIKTKTKNRLLLERPVRLL
jgi:hypothetical protein